MIDKVLEKRIKNKDAYIEKIKEKRKKDIEFTEELKKLCNAKNKTQIIEFVKECLQSDTDCDKIKSIQ